MVNKSRPSVSSFLSTSSKALHTQQELAEAQERIAKLEEELVAERQRIQSQIDGSRISQATVSPSQILRRPYKSRREKDPKFFEELVASIKNYGFRGSIWVQRLPNGQLRLIAGETRLEAGIVAGLAEIPVDIVETDDITAVKLSRVENARRRNLNALDDTEELLYLLALTLGKSREETKKIMYRFKNAAEGNSSIDSQIKEKIEAVFHEVAPDLGVMTFVSSRLPLLELPENVLEAYIAGQLEYTKAVELGRIEDELVRQVLLRETIEQGLSLAALKARIRPTSPRTAIDRMEKLRGQIESINRKSFLKLPFEQRYQLKQTIKELEGLLQQKLKELEE